MKLSQWVASQIEAGRFPSKEQAIGHLATTCKLSRFTVGLAVSDVRVIKYQTAKDLSAATDGACSVTDLCE